MSIEQHNLATQEQIVKSGTHHIASLTPFTDILEREDDLTYLQQEHRRYSIADRYDTTLLNLLRLLQSNGEYESSY